MDLSEHSVTPGPRPVQDKAEQRPWLGVKFVCANQYRRVYRGGGNDLYFARCPSCGRCVRFRVASGGLNHRFYEIDCR